MGERWHFGGVERFERGEGGPRALDNLLIWLSPSLAGHFGMVAKALAEWLFSPSLCHEYVECSDEEGGMADAVEELEAFIHIEHKKTNTRLTSLRLGLPLPLPLVSLHERSVFRMQLLICFFQILDRHMTCYFHIPINEPVKRCIGKPLPIILGDGGTGSAGVLICRAGRTATLVNCFAFDMGAISATRGPKYPRLSFGAGMAAGVGALPE